LLDLLRHLLKLTTRVRAVIASLLVVVAGLALASALEQICQVDAAVAGVHRKYQKTTPRVLTGLCVAENKCPASTTWKNTWYGNRLVPNFVNSQRAVFSPETGCVANVNDLPVEFGCCINLAPLDTPAPTPIPFTPIPPTSPPTP
jgi:hypothetical protein